MTTAAQTPFRATENGGRKHLAQCPYVVGATTRPVRDDEDLPVCDWCARELSGHGRRYFDDLDLALEAFRAPLENRRLIKAELRHVEHDTIWLPYSGSYVALGLEGRGVAWTGKTYVVPRPGCRSRCTATTRAPAVGARARSRGRRSSAHRAGSRCRRPASAAATDVRRGRAWRRRPPDAVVTGRTTPPDEVRASVGRCSAELKHLHPAVQL